MRRRASNITLRIGIALVLIIAAVALFGPDLAPRDPLDRTAVVRFPDGFRGPPYPFFAPGFPLGSDRFGRDTLSRLLWAVRPTFLMVLLVALVRLGLGMAIGAAAAWGRRGGFLDGLISAALAIPALLVALATIAVIGIERGLPAFVVGLSLTGWADTARVTSAQTRILLAQPFIEAAAALGASRGWIVARHILRHLAPLAAILLAGEISAVLMLTVMLGFLGYYIGGGVWIIVSGDAIPVAQRATEYPELGQMLATALDRALDPSQLILVGGVIFVAILGFNLLAEGLRRRAEQPRPINSLAGLLRARLWLAIEDLIVRMAEAPAYQRWSGAALVALMIGGGWWVMQPRAPALPTTVVAPAAAQPGGPLWSGERGNAGGTLAATLPETAPALVWSFETEAPIQGGPAIDAEGIVYLGLRDGTALALDRDGNERWRATLEQPAVGTPAIAADGTVYFADIGGGLAAYTPDGALNWRLQSPVRREATSGPIVGADGTIYLTVVSEVQAVHPDGAMRWVTPRARVFEIAPRLSPAEDMVFLRNFAFNAADGKRMPIRLEEGDEAMFSDPTFLIGADGNAYYRYGHTVVRWQREGDGAAAVAATNWDAARVTVTFPVDTGVTAGGLIWHLYSQEFGDTRVVWLTPDGAVLGYVAIPINRSRVLGVAPDGTLLMCGAGAAERTTCLRWKPGDAEPQWRIEVEGGRGAISGGATADGRLYITIGRRLFVLES